MEEIEAIESTKENLKFLLQSVVVCKNLNAEQKTKLDIIFFDMNTVGAIAKSEDIATRDKNFSILRLQLMKLVRKGYLGTKLSKFYK